MTDTAQPIQVDPYIQKLKNARNKNAVLKFRLASLRSHLPNIPVLAFEGPEDKTIYFHWIRRVRPDLSYEPFPCSGKRQVLRFREMLSRDLGGLSNNVYFFIDRDFDDLAGYPAGADLFMTDRYATENYLVCGEVLVELLKIEYHCHGRPEVRDCIIQLFSAMYAEFLAATREINRRLFVAKRLGIELASHVPQKINEIAVIELQRILPCSVAPDCSVRYSEAPSTEDESKGNSEFDTLDPPTRYRGKFALAFFMRWLECLADDYEEVASNLFGGIDRSTKIPRSEITLGNLASKSPLPEGFAAFVAAIA